jgi:hypothetical protein
MISRRQWGYFTTTNPNQFNLNNLKHFSYQKRVQLWNLSLHLSRKFKGRKSTRRQQKLTNCNGWTPLPQRTLLKWSWPTQGKSETSILRLMLRWISRLSLSQSILTYRLQICKSANNYVLMLNLTEHAIISHTLRAHPNLINVGCTHLTTFPHREHLWSVSNNPGYLPQSKT